MSIISEVLELAGKARRMAVTAEVNDVLIDIQGKVIEAQKEHIETLGRCQKAEEELQRARDWRRRYVIKKTKGEHFVYVLKKSEADGDDAHWLCPNCSNDERRLTLQPINSAVKGSVARCTHCKTDFYMSEMVCFAEDMGSRPLSF